MQYIFQFLIICLYCFIGDLFHSLLPFPIPGSVYGMILLFASLILGFIKPDHLKQTADFLSKIMPLFFVMPCVSILTIDFSTLAQMPIILFITLSSTLLVTGITGICAQTIIKRK